MRRPSRLAVRIYLTVLVQFLVVALALEASRRAGKLPPFGEKQAHFVADDLARVYDDPPKLADEVARAARTLEWTIEVRDASGAVVARADAPTPSPERAMPRHRSRSGADAPRSSTTCTRPGRRRLSSTATFGLVLLVTLVASRHGALLTPLAVLTSAARSSARRPRRALRAWDGSARSRGLRRHSRRLTRLSWRARAARERVPRA